MFTTECFSQLISLRCRWILRTPDLVLTSVLQNLTSGLGHGHTIKLPHPYSYCRDFRGGARVRAVRVFPTEGTTSGWKRTRAVVPMRYTLQKERKFRDLGSKRQGQERWGGEREKEREGEERKRRRNKAKQIRIFNIPHFYSQTIIMSCEQDASIISPHISHHQRQKINKRKWHDTDCYPWGRQGSRALPAFHRSGSSPSDRTSRTPSRCNCPPSTPKPVTNSKQMSNLKKKEKKSNEPQKNYMFLSFHKLN